MNKTAGLILPPVADTADLLEPLTEFSHLVGDIVLPEDGRRDVVDAVERLVYLLVCGFHAVERLLELPTCSCVLPACALIHVHRLPEFCQFAENLIAAPVHHFSPSRH